ncbi:MAG TPA: CSLREA domain-containing protein, partial [Pyrinomonadaceae bacterium]|nr:CSLREA domain-containing protein [Pyrinomonadaceae bacterium]
MKHLLFRISAHRAFAISLALLVTTIVIAQFGASASSGSSGSASIAQAGQAEAITVRAAKRGNPQMNLQDGRSAAATYKDANTKAVSNSLSGARPLSLASGDLNVDGYPDLVVGYASANGDFVTVSLANPEAFAPTKPETIEAIKNGQFSQSFLPEVAVLPVPEAPEFLAVGDFDRDGHLDILTATRGNDTIFLALGDEKGGFSAPQSLHLPGAVTAMVTGQTDNALSAVAVGIQSYAGSQVLVYAARQSVLTDTPVIYSLPATATELAIGQFDDSSPMDLAVAAGNEVLILHDAGQTVLDQKSSAAFNQSQIEHIGFSSVVTSVAVGDFISDRQGRTELAALGNDGTVHVLTQGQLDTRPLSPSEVFEQRQQLAELRERKDFDAVAPRPWRPDQSQSWSEAQSLAGGSIPDAGAAQRLLISAKIATGPGEQLVMTDVANNRLQVVMNDQSAQSASLSSPEAATPHLVSIPLDVEGAPVAALSLRLSVMALPGLVVLSANQTEPVLLPNAPLVGFVVTKATDTNDGACNADCSLREAIVASNANGVGADIITFNAGINPTLTIPSGGGHEDAAATGDLDINSSLTITGNSQTVISTSYTNTCGDCKVFGVNQLGTNNGLSVSFSGVTIQNGFNDGTNFSGTFFETGGGIDFFMTGSANNESMTNCVITNNKTQNGARSHGGGVNVDGANTATAGGPSGGTISFIGCSITNNSSTADGGGGMFLAADKHDANVTNCTVTGNSCTGGDGGGVHISHSFGGTVIVSGGSVSNNTASTSGGGITVTFNQVTSISNMTISNNTATGTGGSSLGGGVLIDTLGATGVTGSTTLTNLTISTNHANNGANAGGGGVRYGGFYAASMTGCTVSGNTSKNGAGVLNNGSTQTPAPTFAISGGSFTGNAATGDGGAFDSIGTGSPTASVTTFSNVTIGGLAAGQPNTAVNGGGIANTQTGSVTVTGNSITGNSATTNGGGIFISGGSFSLDGVTVDSNSATNGDGLHQSAGTFTATNTINFNGDDGINIAGGTFTSTSGTLNLAGSFTRALAATFTHNSGTINFNGAGAQNINGTATSETFNNFIVNKGGGTLTVGGSTTALTMAGAVTLTAGTFAAGTATTIGLPTGNWTNNGGTFTPGSSVVSFTSTAAGQSINGSGATQTFNSITMAKTAQTLSVAGSTTTLNLNGNMLLTSGTFAAGTAANVNVGGNWTNNGATFTPGTGTVTFNGGAAQNLNGTAATQTFNNFGVNKGGGTLTVGGSTTTLNVNNNTLTAGTFSAGTAATINVSGDWTNNGGVFTPGAGNVNFNNAGAAQALNGTNASQTFNNITVAKGAQTLSGAGSLQTLTLNGTMLLTSGTFAAGTLTNIGVGGNWTNNGATFTPASSTVTFNSTTAAQNLNGTAASQTFNNLTVSKTGQTLTGGGSTTTLTLNGNFSITAGTFAAGTITTMNVAGNWANSGTFTPGASNTVIFNGNNNTQTLTGTTTFNNLTSNHTGTGGVTATGSSLTVTGLLRIQAGTFTSSSNFNNVQIDSGTTLASDGSTMNVSGNWVNNGTFTPAGGTVNFNGAGAQSISGSATTETFNNFTVNKSGGSTLSVAANITTLDVNGNLTLTLGTFAAGTATAITV